MLARKDRSIRQMRSALLSKRFSEEIVDRVIERLLARRILDDFKFARHHTRGQIEKGIGADRIRQELQRAEIDPEAIEDALRAESPNEPQWTETVLRRRVERRPEMSRAAACRFLASRGFSEDEVLQAVESVFGAEDRFVE